MKKCLIFLLILLCASMAGCTSEKNMQAEEHVYSHRGASGEEIEHTLAAYDLAVLYGSKYIEQDIVISKDGTLYVSHDQNAKRITGVDALYSDMTDEEIATLSTEDEQKILKLEEVFKRYGASFTYVIELKTEGKTVDKFIEIVELYGKEDQIILQCFNAQVLQEIEKVYPDMPKMYLVSKQENFEAGLELEYVDILSVSKKIMNQENCALAHKKGKLFNVFTLNTTEEIKSAIELGVDSYFTNYTAKAIALEKEYRTN